MTEREQTQESGAEEFALSPNAEIVAFLIGMHTEPAHRGTIAELSRLWNVRRPDGKLISTNMAYSAAREIDACGHLVRHHSRYRISDELCEWIFVEASKSGLAATVLDRIDSEVSRCQTHHYTIRTEVNQGTILALLLGRPEFVDRYLKLWSECNAYYGRQIAIPDFLLSSSVYLQALSDHALARFLQGDVPNEVYSLNDYRPVLSLLKKRVLADPSGRLAATFGVVLADACILMGAPDGALRFDRSPATAANVAFVKGELLEAQRLYEDEIETRTGSRNRNSVELPGLAGYLSVMVLLCSSNRKDLRAALTRAKAGNRNRWSAGGSELLQYVAESLLDPEEECCIGDILDGKLVGEDVSWAVGADDDPIPDEWSAEDEDEEFYGEPIGADVGLALDVVPEPGGQERELPPPSVELLVCLLAKKWTDSDWQHSGSLMQLAETAHGSGYAWVAAQFEAMAMGSCAFLEEHGLLDFSRMLVPEPKWRRRLAALQTIVPEAGVENVSSKATRSRLVWVVEAHEEFRGECAWSLRPYEQKPKKRGDGYKKGSLLGLQRFYGQFDFDGEATEQDREIARFVHKLDEDAYSYSYRESHGFLPGAWKALVSHPLVFFGKREMTPIEVVTANPELTLRRVSGRETVLAFTETIPRSVGLHLELEQNAVLRVREIKESHLRIARVIGRGLQIPDEGRSDVLDLVARLSKQLTVHSDLALDHRDVESRTADERLRVRLTPLGDGLQAAIVVSPFGDGGPTCEPGRGTCHMVARIEDKQMTVQRNLDMEVEHVRALKEACPSLAYAEDLGGALALDSPASALTALAELQEMDSDAVLLEWPEGEVLKLRAMLDSKDMEMTISSGKDWFAVDGQVTVNADLVLDLRTLLRLAREQTGDFVRLDDGTFIRLARHFRKLLDGVDHVCADHRGELRLHPLAAPMIDELVDDEGVDACDEWSGNLDRIRAAGEQTFELPSTLAAELRDYQEEGVRWLARLAYWQVGACLADDMGLGKTIQALTIILARAESGPSLVVAPASVVQNWQSETLRFTPTLRPILLHEEERQKVLSELGPYDLLITTYGIMQNELELLTACEFQVIVLDEAQAIKNRTTKRAKAVRQLQGEFRIATTGTPIENHLGELWSLFQFLNPGLLGPYDSFNQRFAVPIERNHNKDARHLLKRLVSPFILRRLKNEILDELPPKTEIELKVELSSAEQAFYEALRQEAIERLENATDQDPRFAALAEIMRLRRACCNPGLVNPEVSIPSSKLALFVELVEELRENNHKALVFSQFVGHLNLIRDTLDKRSITYCYLDGSTPLAKRSQQVDNFQAGRADLFLISLKAGGTGLNLTAADYVIHMDPWWNPAVEDQASDRAHRIGQIRPVTVYRLITKGTIEEQIVELHKTKRDLADSLLEGTDQTGRIGLDELLQLLRDV